MGKMILVFSEPKTAFLRMGSDWVFCNQGPPPIVSYLTERTGRTRLLALSYTQHALPPP